MMDHLSDFAQILRKIFLPLFVVSVALYPTNSYAQPPTLASIMEAFVTGPDCSPGYLMRVRFTVAIKAGFIDPQIGFGDAVDDCLERKYPFSIFGRPIGLPYFEFNASQILHNAKPGSSPLGNFELTLGERFISKQFPSTLGTLKIEFRDGTTRGFVLSDSLNISSNGRFLYGELGDGEAVITIVISPCGIEECF